MTVSLIIIGILGIFISIFNMYGGAGYIAVQRRLGMQASVMPHTFWQLNTQPALSAIFLLILRHWIFTIPISLTIIQMLIGAIQRDEKSSTIRVTFPYLSIMTFIGRMVLVIAPAIILTLLITHQAASSSTFMSIPWIWLWCFPLLSVAFWFVTILASAISSRLLGVFAYIIYR